MIRKAIADDFAEILACATAAYAPYVAAIGRRPAPMEADFAAQIEAGQIHASVQEDGCLQGFILFYPQDRHMFIESIAVRPEAMGRGVGKCLIRFCEDEARRQGSEAVHLYTNEKMTANLLIYPRLGYVEVGRGIESGFSRVFFVKPLG